MLREVRLGLGCGFRQPGFTLACMSSYVRGIILYSRYWDSPLGPGSTLSVLDPWRPRLGSPQGLSFPVLRVHPLFSFPYSFSLGESVIEKRKKRLQEKQKARKGPRQKGICDIETRTVTVCSSGMRLTAKPRNVKSALSFRLSLA